MSIQDSISIRQLQASDLNFILSSSLQCLTQYTDSLFKGWDRKELYSHLEKAILYALNHCNYSIFIACDAKDSEHIIGYLVGDPTTNHIFLQYTKYAYRKLGIQKLLLLPLIIDSDYPSSVNWGTKEMQKLHKLRRISVKDLFTEQLMQLAAQSKLTREI